MSDQYNNVKQGFVDDFLDYRREEYLKENNISIENYKKGIEVNATITDLLLRGENVSIDDLSKDQVAALEDLRNRLKGELKRVEEG